MTDTTTVVTGLGRHVVTTGGGGALFGDVTSLATGVTLGHTSLAVTGKVVWTTTLVASGLAGGDAGSTWSLTLSLTLWLWCLGGWDMGGWLWTVSGDVAELGAVVTTGTLALLGAVALDVADTTAVVALLLCVLSWLRAVGGLVAWLTTVVAETLLLGADLSDVTDLATLVTGSWENSSHCSDQCVCVGCKRLGKVFTRAKSIKRGGRP